MMENNGLSMQAQVDEINRKLDFIIEELHAERQNRESMKDLTADLSIIGKDIFKTSVRELDKAGVEINPDELTGLGLRLVRNLDKINMLLDTLESVHDFMKDASPILHQVGLSAINKMNELEQRGYIDFIREMAKVMDNVVVHFKPEDMKALADNIVTILETVKSITQPDMLQAVNNAIMVYKHLDNSEIEEYSLFKLLREMRSPEMKRGLGFMVSFLKNLSKESATVK